MHALVTGITGCVGSNLAATLLRQGMEVTGLRQPGASTLALDGLKVRLVEGDILDPDALRRAMQGVEWVFHVAGIADDWNYPARQVYRTNVEGTRNVLDAALKAGVGRCVLTGSAAALGLPTKEKPVLDEQCTFNIPPSRWLYAHTKHLAEQVMQEYVARGLDAVAVLPTAIMGPGDLNFVVGQIIVRVLNGEIIPLPPGGSNVIDVRDVAEAHLAAALHGRTGERYVLAGHNLPHDKMIAIVSQALGIKARYIQIPRAVLPPVAAVIALMRALHLPARIDPARVHIAGMYVYYDASKAIAELGLRARPFSQTVRDTYEWYTERRLIHTARQHRLASRAARG